MLNNQPLSTWTNHLETIELKDEFSLGLVEASHLFSRLKDIAEIKIGVNGVARAALSSYDKPAWSEFQADANGYERALKEILSLINFT